MVSNVQRTEIIVRTTERRSREPFAENEQHPGKNDHTGWGIRMN